LGFAVLFGGDIIIGLLPSAFTQALLNDSPGEAISHQQGLRLGDPLPLILFILVMDVFSYMVKKASEMQPLARTALQHHISLYADDVVIFLRPLANDVDITLGILHLFDNDSGLRINMQKRKLFSHTVLIGSRPFYSTISPCQLLDFPCKYTKGFPSHRAN